MTIKSWERFSEAKSYNPKQQNLFNEIKLIMYIVTDEGGSYTIGRIGRTNTCILRITTPSMGSPWDHRGNPKDKFTKNEYPELKDRLEEIANICGYDVFNPNLTITGGEKVADLKSFIFKEKKSIPF